jgi:hypothetical protein
MFRHCPLSVGVANIRKHLPQMNHRPAAIVSQPSGLGFAEMAEAWLRHRTGVTGTVNTSPAGF